MLPNNIPRASGAYIGRNRILFENAYYLFSSDKWFDEAGNERADISPYLDKAKDSLIKLGCEFDGKP